MFNGMFGITHLSNAQTRSITAENGYGEKGRGGMAEPHAAFPHLPDRDQLEVI